MKRILLSALALGAIASFALVNPAGAALTTTTKKTNPQGKETQGKGKAQTPTTTTTNPSGRAPPGANK